jgi:hypothetical protein
VIRVIARQGYSWPRYERLELALEILETTAERLAAASPAIAAAAFST